MLIEKSKTLPHARSVELSSNSLRRIAIFLGEQLGAAALGALLAQSGFAKDVFLIAAPFAIALAAAGSIRRLGMEVLGIALGCLLLDYPIWIAVMTSAAVAGLFNLALRKLGLKRKIFVPLCAFACSAASCIICLLQPQTAGNDSMVWIYALCGAVLSGCAAYFIVLAQAGIQTGNGGEEAGGKAARGRYRINRRERAALLLCCGMALAASGGFSVGIFRPVHVLAVLFVLAAAYCWREAGGAIAGCCAGAALALAGDDPSITAVFALGGLLSGVFSGLHMEGVKKNKLFNPGYHRVHQSVESSEFHPIKPRDTTSDFFTVPSALHTVPLAGAFALVCMFYVALRTKGENDPAGTVVFAIECLLSILIFIFVPGRIWELLRRRFAAPGEASFAPAESEAALQLSQTACALRKVGEYVEEVSQGLEKLQIPPGQVVFTQAVEAVCRNCLEYPYCHEEHGASAALLSGKLIKCLKKQNILPLEDLELARRECGLTQPCRKPDELWQALVRAYDIQCARTTSNRAESQLRHAAAKQFDTLSSLLEELGGKLARQKAFDVETAESAMRVLEDHGFRTRNVVCSRSGEMAAQLHARVLPEEDHSSREQLAEAIRRATGISFELPERSRLSEEGESVLTFAQRPGFKLHTGAVQMSSSSSDYCGDYFDCFSDGQGREVLVISDGMGTGGRAAVDSALATEIFSQLVRSGLSFEGAMRIANQALLLKSCEESLATLDAAGVNLYTGEVEFCKAGGAASFLRRRGTASKVELSALPAGILRSIHPARFQAMLEPGDVLVLVSDGMLCGSEREGWLCGELEAWEDDDMQALAEHLAGLVVQQRQEKRNGQEFNPAQREDDLTVICGRLTRR